MWQTSKQEAISWIQQHIECITQQRSGESSVYTVLSLFYEGRETIFDSLLTQVYISKSSTNGRSSSKEDISLNDISNCKPMCWNLEVQKWKEKRFLQLSIYTNIKIILQLVYLVNTKFYNSHVMSLMDFWPNIIFQMCQMNTSTYGMII